MFPSVSISWRIYFSLLICCFFHHFHACVLFSYFIFQFEFIFPDDLTCCLGYVFGYFMKFLLIYIQEHLTLIFLFLSWFFSMNNVVWVAFLLWNQNNYIFIYFISSSCYVYILEWLFYLFLKMTYLFGCVDELGFFLVFSFQEFSWRVSFSMRRSVLSEN